jgi:hypothetical protein
MNQVPSVEDILIGQNRPPVKKKSKAPIVIIFLLIIILLVGGAGAYYYYTNYMVEGNKEKFFKYLGTTNISNIFNTDEIDSILDKKQTKSNKSDFSLNVNTNFELSQNELDISKFQLSINNISNKENNSNSSEINLNYADNDLFQIKTVSDQDYIGITSDEISNKYLVTKKENLSETLEKLGVDVDSSSEDILNDSDSSIMEKTDLTEDERKTFLSDCVSIAYNSLNEDKFTSNENIIIKLSDGQSLQTNAYTLSITNSEMNYIYVDILKAIRNDEDLLSKIVTEKSDKTSSTSSANSNTSVNTNVNVNTNTNVNTNAITNVITNENQGSNNIANQITVTENQSDLTMMRSQVTFANFTSTTDTEIEETDEVSTNSINVDSDEINTDIDIANTNLNQANNTDTGIVYNYLETDDEDETYNGIDLKIFAAILSGYKINYTTEKVQNLLDEEIAEIDNYPTDETENQITVYVSDDIIRKITIKSDEVNIEIEFTTDNNKNSIKFTILQADEITKLSEIFTIPEEILLSDQDTSEQNTLETQNSLDVQENVESDSNKLVNGYSFKIEKTVADATSKLYLELDFIDNLEINEKLTLSLNIKGITSLATQVKNEAVITYTNSEGQITANANYNISFEENLEDIPEINNDTSIFMDDLTDDDFNSVVEQVEERILAIIDQKAQDLNLIDINNNSLVVESTGTVVNEEAKQEAKNKLIEVISNEMGVALTNGEEYTLANLANLTIDGYNVTVRIVGDIAVVSVNGYVFDIDSAFNLTEE